MGDLHSLSDYRQGPLRAGFDGHGSGGDDGGMEARVAKLEASLEHVQREVGEVKQDVRELRRDHERDFRILFGAIITTALGLAGLLAKGFKWL